MSAHVLHALAEAGLVEAVVVIPPDQRGDRIQQTLSSDCPAGIKLRFAVQQVPHGTADALLAARSQIESTDESADLIVVNGDLPLLSSEQIGPIMQAPAADVIVATATVEDPARMGRIVRHANGLLRAIVESRDASQDELAIREVNLGIYRFSSRFLWPTLERIVGNAEAGAESYATDAIAVAAKHNCAVAVPVSLPDGRLNVETPSDAADAEDVIRAQIVKRLLDNGVRVPDRAAVWIDARAQIAPGVSIEPGTHIRGASSVGGDSRIGPNAIIEDSALGERCHIESCTIRGSTLHDDVEVGPYSTLRPGCEIGPRVHIGTHAELKAARIGEAVQIGHFSYLGDVTIGAHANIGAGTITCNFDGVDKHQTEIGEDAFLGCDTMLIAPRRVGARARTGAGAVVNKDVPDDATAVGHPARLVGARSTQRRSPGRDSS